MFALYAFIALFYFKNMKILITGGAGFIGSHLAEELLSRGDSIYIIDNLSTGSANNIEHLMSDKKFHYTFDTIMNFSALKELVNQCDMIFHLAAAVGVRLIVDSPVKTLETNIKGTELVLEAAAEKNKLVILASTSEIYGKNNNIPFKEDDDIVLGATKKQRWSYGCSKAVNEFMALAYYKEKGLDVVITRLFNTIGPRQTGDYGMVVPRFVKQALAGNPLTVYGDGTQTRSFTYVGDVVSALVDLSKEKKAIGEIFNIGGPDEISIINVAKKVIELTKSKSKIEFIPYEKAYASGFEDIQRRVADISKIKRLTGFKPKTKLEDALELIINYYKKESNESLTKDKK